MAGHIIALGGGGFSTEPDNLALDRYVVPCGNGRIGTRESVSFRQPAEIALVISAGFTLRSRNYHAGQRIWR